MENAEIGIIGGTGIYDPGLLEDSKELSIETPYGAPSALKMIHLVGHTYDLIF